MQTLLKLAEQCKNILGKGDTQAYIASVIDAYGSVAKKEFYENKQDGVAEVDGVFIYTFGKADKLVPVLDVDTDMYYIWIPSSSLRLPHEMGINQVSAMKGQKDPFVRITAGSLGIWENLKANAFGGRQTYMVEGTKMYFPKMTSDTVTDILLKMAIALDTVDVEETLNIPPSVADAIVSMVIAKFAGKPDLKPENLQ